MRKQVLNIPIDWISRDEALRKIKTFIASGSPHQITTVNTEFLMLSRQNKDFKQALLDAELSLADGTGVVLAQSLDDLKPGKSITKRTVTFLSLGFQFLFSPQSFKYSRITGVELSERIVEASETVGWKIFLLGGQPASVPEEAAQRWLERYPNANFVGTSGADPGPDAVEAVRKAAPDILLVAYGAPKQDVFIWKNKDKLRVPVMIGVGGTFDTVTGRKYNPPRWIKALGLEWFTYLIRYPSRFKRIWRATVGFFVTVIRNG